MAITGEAYHLGFNFVCQTSANDFVLVINAKDDFPTLGISESHQILVDPRGVFLTKFNGPDSSSNIAEIVHLACDSAWRYADEEGSGFSMADTPKDIISEFQRYLKIERGLADTTVSTYAHHVGAYLKSIAKREVEAETATKNDVFTLIGKLKERGIRSCTV